MRRLRRIIVNALTVLSLLLCVATVGLWVRSSFNYRQYIFSLHEYMGFAIVADAGSVTATCEHYAQLQTPQNSTNCFHQSEYGDASFWFAVSGDPLLDSGEKGRLGFGHQVIEGYLNGLSEVGSPPDYRSKSFTAPCWLVVGVFAILPIVRLRGALRVRRISKTGSCPHCSYNLAGNVSGVCPECGAACKAADPAGVSPAAGV